jgi:flagellar FliL protein
MAKETSEENKEVPKKQLPLKLILTGLFVLVNLGVSVGGLVLVYMSTLGYERQPITEERAMASLKKTMDENEEPVIYTMDPLTVNLDGQPRRIVRAVISLEMMDGKGFEEVVRLGAHARDGIVKLFNRKRFSDIETIQGKLNLKDQIASIVNAELKEGTVKDVYFNEFVVQ